MWSETGIGDQELVAFWLRIRALAESASFSPTYRFMSPAHEARTKKYCLCVKESSFIINDLLVVNKVTRGKVFLGSWVSISLASKKIVNARQSKENVEMAFPRTCVTEKVQEFKISFPASSLPFAVI
jgi:hypothetical protein